MLSYLVTVVATRDYQIFRRKLWCLKTVFSRKYRFSIYVCFRNTVVYCTQWFPTFLASRPLAKNIVAPLKFFQHINFMILT